ncbi:MAG: hypothetical protein KBB39_12535 [Phycicoccus sp.]|nr:hypothetical protein [Phycicoccus sp.]
MRQPRGLELEIGPRCARRRTYQVFDNGPAAAFLLRDGLHDDFGDDS